MKKLLLIPALVLGLVLGTGCDRSDDDDLDGPLVQGQGMVKVTGATTSNYTGQAFWTVVDEDDEGPMFMVAVIRGSLATWSEDNMEIVGLFGGTTRPPAGQYALGGENYAGMYVRVTQSAERFALSMTGSMNLTTSTSTRIVGTSNFTGMLMNENAQSLGNVTVQMSFDAVYIDPDDLPEEGEVALREQARKLKLAL